MSAEGSVLVTGSAGFVGRHVVASLRAAGRDVVEIPHRWEDVGDVLRLVAERKPETCVHLGWHAEPQNYLTSVGQNARSLHDTLALMRGLDRLGLRRCVLAGSSAEYAPSALPLSEDGLLAPRTVYGSAKALCHELLRTVERPSGMAVVWARLFNIVGPGERPGRVLPSVARSLLRGAPIALTEGQQIRDYIDVRDAAAALAVLACVPCPAPEVVNIASGTGTALRDVLLLLAEVVGRPELLEFGVRAPGPDESPVVVADVARLTGLAGWERQRPLAQTAADVVAYWRTHDEVADAP